MFNAATICFSHLQSCKNAEDQKKGEKKNKKTVGLKNLKKNTLKIHVKLKCALCNICHEADRNLLSSRAYDLPERRQRVILTKRRKKNGWGYWNGFKGNQCVETP